jgi:hypothetical protein
MSNDLHSINGRIKNHLARKDLAVTPAGTILINSFCFLLKDLYDFADTLVEADAYELNKIIERTETMPLNILTLTTPSAEEMEKRHEEYEERMAREQFLQHRIDALEDSLWEALHGGK